MSHTPGPWRAEASPQSSHFDYIVRAERLSIGINTHNAEADARLIAAAPDLLAALKRMVKDSEGMRMDYSDLEDAMVDALAAIAKATGAA